MADEVNKRYGFRLTRQTLASWRDTGDWDGRIRRADARCLAIESTGVSYDQYMFNALLRRLEAYERYFDTLPDSQVDNNAQWAMNDVVKKLEALLKTVHIKEIAEAAPGEERERLVSRILRETYGIER